MYYYGARWYDTALGRWVQPDSIIPEPGNPLAYDRYAYVYNNSLRYVDPTGHFTEEEICKYWGYCSEQDAREGLGKDLFSILWNTEITWGDTLLLGNQDGVQSAAAFILKWIDGKYSAALWDINNGVEIRWGVAKNFTRMAAYNQRHNVWETADSTGNWGSRQDAQEWAGYTPTTHNAKDLFLNWQYEGYFLTNYLQFDLMWYLATGISLLGSITTGQVWITIISIALTATGALDDAELISFIGGPKPVTYPLLVFRPYYPPSPCWIWFSVP